MNNEKEKKTGLAREGITYLIFGVLTTVIDYAISNLLYYIWKMDPIPAQTIAWVAAVLFAFVTNKWWVFESKNLQLRAMMQEFVSFVSCRLFTGACDLLIMYVFVDCMGMNDLFIKIASNVLVVILNYVASKLIIFRKKG